jgi:hypothetical protein
MTSLSRWIENSTKKRASTPPPHASAARSAAGRPARMITGLVTAATSGTPSRPEAFVQHASTSGLRPNALLHPGVTALRLVYKVNRRYPTLQQEGRRASLNITETNRRIAEQFNEAFNRGDLDTAASCFAEDCQNHGRKVGRGGVRGSVGGD